MKTIDLKDRKKKFSLSAITIVSGLEYNMVSKVLGNKLLRSGTSVGANCRAACRVKSSADFINKIAIVIEEADETQFWIKLMVKSSLVKREVAAPFGKKQRSWLKFLLHHLKQQNQTK